jgi:hypothetical membrane protein
MRVKQATGIAFVIVGLGLILLGIFNLNNLLFMSNITGLSNLPVYVSLVIEPVLYGVLALFDGLCIMSAARRLSAALYFAGNVTWFLGILELSNNLSIPTLEIARYQPVMLYFLAAFLFFVTALLINTAGGGRKSRGKEERRKLGRSSDEDDLKVQL